MASVLRYPALQSGFEGRIPKKPPADFRSGLVAVSVGRASNER